MLIDIIIDERFCGNFNKSELDTYLKDIENSVIIYSARLPYYHSKKDFFISDDLNTQLSEVVNYPNNVRINFKKEISKTINLFIDNNNQVIIIYPIPEQIWNVSKIYDEINRNKRLNHIGYPQNYWEERGKESYKIYDSLSNQNIYRFFPDEIFCNSFIENVCVGALKNRVFYIDGNHLSMQGAQLISDELIKIINKITK